VDKVLATLKERLGDHWSDDLAGEVQEVLAASVEAEVARSTDAAAAKLLAAEKAAKSSAAEARKLAAQLESAGKDTNEALAQAREEAAKAAADVERLRADVRARDVRDAALEALLGADLPEERRGVALQSLDLSGVDVDESGKVVGLSTAVETLKAAEPWLWEQALGKGAGKRQGGDPPAKPPPPSKPSDVPVAVQLLHSLETQRRRDIGAKPITLEEYADGR
jgi:hypothetical protein